MEVKVINKSGYLLPTYYTPHSAGMDLRAILNEDITLYSLERKLIPTRLYIELPQGSEAQIRPRSGLAYKYGITILNSPGTIDSDYRGEIKILLVNLSKIPYTVRNGDRIAQIIVSKYEHIIWREVKQLTSSLRENDGYGSTGIK